MLAELRKWHAQMCLRLDPQDHENSLTLEVCCIILDVCFIALAPFLRCFVASVAPGRMNNVFRNHQRNPRVPKADSRTRRARTPTPFLDSFLTVFCIVGCLGASLPQVWKRMPKKSETRLSKPSKWCSRLHGSTVFISAAPPRNDAVLVHSCLHVGPLAVLY